MKNQITLGLLLLAGTACAQSETQQFELLEKENLYLKNALHISKPQQIVTASKIDFKLIKVTGNAKEQTVTLHLLLVNRDANKDFQFAGSKAIDAEGNDYNTHTLSVGSTGIRSKIYTDTPVKATVEFKNVLPAVKTLKLTDIRYYDPEKLGKTLSIQFEGLSISWM